MEEETLKIINKKIRDLIQEGSVSANQMALELINAINNPLIGGKAD
jgi:hypothetical protein|uniref:Uncharacterized protein n=1 Tax=Siphoviridae sp. ct1yA16 TaxID=2827767 RepID=A0A8S5TFH3_9CAUD|nr:MAG TPA: hypothetical protein [Siphoviridae sp. ct1yA16]